MGNYLTCPSTTQEGPSPIGLIKLDSMVIIFLCPTYTVQVMEIIMDVRCEHSNSNWCDGC